MATVTVMRIGKVFASEFVHFWNSTLENWVEWLATFFLAGCSGIVALTIQPRERVAFFDNFNERYPYSGETIGTPILGILIILLPIATIGLASLIFPHRIDLSLAGMGLAQSLCLTLFITEALKVTVARPRPNFFSYCGWNATIEKCTGKPSHRRDARLSFPSGHASNSFAAGTWMSLFIGSFQKSGELWMILMRLIPIGLAIFVAATRITDYMHHVSDVVAGSVIGIGVGALVFTAQAQRVFMVNKKKAEDDELDPFGGMGDEL
jgi:membrane-associated phospholipid phosphatase